MIFISFIVLALFTISAASASDLNSTDIALDNGSSLQDAGINEIYVDNHGSNSNDGTKDSPVKTIANAISTVSDNATIYMADGEFRGDGNTRLNIDKSLSFIGSDDTTINGLGKDYIFIVGDGVSVTFKNIKFVNAYKSPESYSVSYNEKVYGACLDIKNATVNIDNCSFENNVLSYGSMDNYIYGGAVSNFGDLTVTNSKFINNTALSTSGLYSYGGGVYNKGKARISNTSFIDSKSVDFGNGAAISNDGEITVENSKITGSVALHETKGSAIYNTGVFNLVNSIVDNNYIERANFNYIYGAIYNSGTFNARGNIFKNNTGYYEAPNPSYRGSPNIYNSGKLNLTYNAFIDNAPFEGIYRDLYYNGGDIVTVDNNWWNTNENPYSHELTNIMEINSWIMLNVTPEYSKLNISDSVSINAIWTNNINSLPQIDSIPVFNITFKTNVSNNVITSTKQMTNGQAEFVFDNTQNKGLYTVTANLNSFSQDVLVDVGKVVTDVKFTYNENITYLDDLMVDVEVTSRDGSIPTGVVLLKINDETYTVNLTNGKGSAVISNLTPDKYNLDVIYDGSENHFKAFNKTTVSIKKLDIDLALTIPEIKVSQKGQLIATLGPKNVQGQAIVYVDGVRKKIAYLYNGNTTIALNNFAEGEYNLTLEFVETQIYNSKTVSGILKVTRYDCDINITAADIKVGENATVTITVSPESLRGEANLIINGVENTIFIDNSTTNVTLSNLEGGNYNVELIFDGDLRYYPVNASTSFKVLRTPTVLDVKINQNDDLNGTISVKVNPSNASGVVGVYVNYNSYSLNLTNGQAEFAVKFDKGTNYIFVYYEGNDLFEGASWNTTLGVDDEFAFIGENSTGFEHNDFNYTVRLIEVNGIPMPGRVINIEINGEKYTVTTDNNGFAYLKLNLAAGKYSVSATYNNKTIYNTLSVKKVDFNLTYDDIAYGETESLRAIFENGVKGSVKFIVNGEQTVIDIINGTAVYDISGLKVGSYSVDAVYLEITKSGSFNVNKADLDLNVTASPATSFIDEIINVNNLANATGSVIFVFNGKEHEIAITDGKASLNLSKLDEGTYSITVRYSGDDNYMSSSKTISFYIKEFASDMVLTVENAVYGDDLIASVSLNGNATGTVKFTIGNITKEVNISDGKAVYNFKGIGAGNYNLTAYYGGDSYYIPSSNETSFKVMKANSTIELFVKEVALGENIRIYANLSPNASGNVVFSMTGYFSPRNKPISNSMSTWYIAPLNTGEYEVIARYLGDSNYYESNTTFLLNVSQKKSILDVDLSDAGISDRIICKVTLKSNDGEKLSSSVVLKVNGRSYTVDVTDGSGSLVLGKLPVGNYSYEVSYDGDENYTSAIYQGTFKVVDDLLTANLTAQNLTKYYGGSDKLQITLKDSNNRPFASQVVTVKIGSKEYKVTTNTNGQAFFDASLNPGTYKATITYDETDRYHGAEANATVTILSTVEGIDVVKLYGSGTQYFAIFTDANGKALSNTKITFKLSGKSYTISTLPNGIARININIKPGTYTITSVNPATGEKLTNKITIYYQIMGKDSSNYIGAKTTYKVRIYNSNLKPVGAGKVVKFKINGKTYKVKTNKNGYAKLSVKLKTAKKYTVTVTYSKYKISNKITVKKLLSAKNISKKKSKTAKFKAKLVNSKGKVQKGKKLTFKIDGKKYTAKTNKKGIATIKIKTTLKVGKHKIVTSYGKNKITNTITVTK